MSTAPPGPPFDSLEGAERLRQVADLNRQLFLAHPWLADISSARPPLGPGVMAKYEYELTAFARFGLNDITTDDCLNYLLTLCMVRSAQVCPAGRQQSHAARENATAGPRPTFSRAP